MNNHRLLKRLIVVGVIVSMMFASFIHVGAINVSAQSTALFSGGNGSLYSPFIISTDQDLMDIGSYTSGMLKNNTYSTSYFNNAHYIQDSDIDLQYSFGFIPIGFMQINGFTGTYNGNCFTISNLMIDFDRSRAFNIDALGLFSYTHNATISNIIVDKPIINVLGQARDNVGGIVGFAENTTIVNCEVIDASINTPIANFVGGIVGYASSTLIETCDVTGGFINASDSDYIAGIAGYIEYTTIADCRTDTSIIGRNYVGGVFGFSAGTMDVYDSFSKSDITGEDSVGGIGGHIEISIGELTNCYTEGTINGSSHVGGIVGIVYIHYAWHYSITDNYSYATLNGDTTVGGIVGAVYASYFVSALHIGRNYVNNAISATTSYAGGIAGFISSSLIYSADIESNYVISNISAPSAATDISILANGPAGIYTNNYYSFESTITGGVVGCFENATIVYHPEINLQSWWENKLGINVMNRFNTDTILNGFLPTILKRDQEVEVRGQVPMEYKGNKTPIAQNIIYESGSNLATQMQINTFGAIVTNVVGLTKSTHYILNGSNVIFRPAYLETLPEGRTMVTIVFNSGHKVNAFIDVMLTLPPPPAFVSTSVQVDLDNEDNALFRISANDMDLAGIIANQTQVFNITNGSNTRLTLGDDFTFANTISAGNRRLIISYDYLFDFSPGVYEFRIVFNNNSEEIVTVTIM